MAEEVRDASEWRPEMVMDRRYGPEVHANHGRTPYRVRRRDNVDR